MSVKWISVFGGLKRFTGTSEAIQEYTMWQSLLQCWCGGKNKKLILW